VIWEEFIIPFISPMRIGDRVYKTRKGLYLKHSNKKAELSPILELHGISLEDAKLEIDQLIPKINFNKTNLDFQKPLFNLCPELNNELNNISSSALFCLESLALEVLGLTNNIEPVQYNGLFVPGISSLDDSLENVLKVKIGRLDPNFEIDIMKSLIAKGHILRPDGNLSLSMKQLTHLMKDIPKDKIDYLEEPLKDISEWNKFNEQYCLNLALDENLLEYYKDKNLLSVTTWVVKPSVHFSISGTLKLIEEAKTLGKTLVISSAFETKIGMKSLKYLASKQDKNKATFHGLDTLKYLDSLPV
jgi:O-succinylbenzoate synthase